LVVEVCGIVLVFAPIFVADALGRPHDTPTQLINLRASWGGTIAGLGAFVAWLPAWRPWWRVVVGLAMWAMAGVGAARLGGIALARPRVAVAPLDGDNNQRVGDVVAEAVADHAKVTPQDKVARAMDKLRVTELDKKSVKALRTRLEVDAVVHGRVEKAGAKKR